MQTLIVILIVAVAAIYVGRVFYRGVVQKKNCACGCSDCGIKGDANEPTTESKGP